MVSASIYVQPSLTLRPLMVVLMCSLPCSCLTMASLCVTRQTVCCTYVGVEHMIRNLTQEREAVLAFLFTVCDEVRNTRCRTVSACPASRVQ